MSNLSPTVKDHIPVGTPEILDSPHVTEGPGRIAKAPVPSIYVDDRGDIHRLRVGGKRINLLSSCKGVMRSGYLHPHTLHDTVIAGKVEVWTLTQTGTVKTVYNEKDHFSVPPYVPHILYFLDDSILAEWWDTDDFQCWYYHPYRKIIDVQNSLIARDHEYKSSSGGVSGATGRHQRLVPQDEAAVMTNKKTKGLATAAVGLAVGVVTGVVVGVILGLALGESSSSSGSSPERNNNNSSSRS